MQGSPSQGNRPCPITDYEYNYISPLIMIRIRLLKKVLKVLNTGSIRALGLYVRFLIATIGSGVYYSIVLFATIRDLDRPR